MRFAVVLSVLIVAAFAGVKFDAKTGWVMHNGLRAVQGNFTSTQDTNGWYQMNITDKGSELKDAKDIWYAAGVFEGTAAQAQIWQLYVNTVQNANNSMTNQVLQWVNKHINYMLNMVAVNPDDDPYWTHVGLVFQQIYGVADGYASVAPANQRLQVFDIFMINFAFELGDVQQKFTKDILTRKRGGCSALIKPTATDLFMSHITWSGFETMLRVYKTLDLSGVKIAFSSYPATLHSGDDWYITSTGLAVQETTNGNYNQASYEYVVPETVSEFIRVIISLWWATNGADWTSMFCAQNSGTYNNQWMVVDMKLYTPGSPFADNTLWLAEQMPGLCHRGDVSPVVAKTGYWASFNLPYFPDVFLYSGTAAMEKQYGSFFSYTNYSRPLIFAREQGKITDLEGMKRMMRYNEFKTDPFSKCAGCTDPPYSAMLTIASRGDLNPANATWGPLAHWVGQRDHGATDAKIASWSGMANLVGVVISGPTYQDQPPFVFSTSPFSKVTHVGIPDNQTYPWVTFVGN